MTVNAKISGVSYKVPEEPEIDARITKVTTDIPTEPVVEEIDYDLNTAKTILQNKLGRLPSHIPKITIAPGEEVNYGFRVLGTFSHETDTITLAPGEKDKTGVLAHELAHELIWELTKGSMTPVEIDRSEILAYAVYGSGEGYKRIADELE